MERVCSRCGRPATPLPDSISIGLEDGHVLCTPCTRYFLWLRASRRGDVEAAELLDIMLRAETRAKVGRSERWRP